MQKSKLPLTHALGWIVASTLLINGAAYTFLKHYLRYKYSHAFDPKYTIRTVVQTGPQREALKTEYLAELMGLSVDHPQSGLLFDLAQAKKNLLCSPLISKAEVKLLQSNTLYVDYTVRQPVAWLLDYENVAVDKEGIPIPFFPFFSPKIFLRSTSG